MAIKQVSVFVANQKGKLSDVVKKISGEGINIRALSIADTEEFGILRLIVSDADKAVAALSDIALVKKTDVIAVKMNDIEGALYDVLKVLEEADIDVNYSYAFTSPENAEAYVVFRVDSVPTAEAALAEKGIACVSEGDLKI